MISFLFFYITLKSGYLPSIHFHYFILRKNRLYHPHVALCTLNYDSCYPAINFVVNFDENSKFKMQSVTRNIV